MIEMVEKAWRNKRIEKGEMNHHIKNTKSCRQPVHSVSAL